MKCNRSPVMTGFMTLIALLSNGANAGGKLDDATILAIFDQANSVDIYTGQLGAKYGSSEEVRALGRMVATDHIAVQQMGRDLAKKLGIMPTPPADDTSVMDHARTVALLQSRFGTEFDKEYLRHEIAFHQSVIDAVKGALLPAIGSGEFKKLVRNVLPGFEHHLAETKAVAQKLGVE
jgi:putative membrane protein